MNSTNTNKIAIMTMGLPGAGKSYVLENNFKDFMNTAVYVDPDQIKSNHPDYDASNPAPLHAWSKKVAKKMVADAIYNERNMIIDGTGTNTAPFIKTMKDLQSAGYIVKVLYVKVRLQTSLKRNQERERHVPEEIIYEKYESIEIAYSIISEYADQMITIKND